MAREVMVRVPATSANLGPGFDCVGMSLSLFNTVEAVVSDQSGIRIEITGEGRTSLPRDKSNLVYQTMLDFSKRVGRRLPPGIFLKMHNDIPSTRGLGSSATAIVAGLSLANEILDCGKTREDLLQLACDIEGHPDNVAPAILGGVVVAGTHPNGNRVISKRFTLPPTVKAVVAIPTYEVSTDKSRAALPAVIPRQDAVYNVCQVGIMMASLAQGDFATFADFANDRLHEPYRLPLMPGTQNAIGIVREAGANCVTLSGSGPTLLALFETSPAAQSVETDVVIGAFQRAFLAEQIEAKVLELEPDLQGLVVQAR